MLLRSEINIFGNKKVGSSYTIKLRGNIHAQGATLNINIAWDGGGEGFFSLDVKFVAK